MAQFERQTDDIIIDIYVVEWTGTYGLNAVPTPHPAQLYLIIYSDFDGAVR